MLDSNRTGTPVTSTLRRAIANAFVLLASLVALLASNGACAFELRSVHFPVFNAGYLTDARYKSQIDASLDELATTGANDVIVELSVYMKDRTSSNVLELASMSEGNANLATLIQGIKRRGLKVSFKPSLKYLAGGDGTFNMQPADMVTWFASYKQMLVAYAQFAQAQGVSVLYVGNELGTGVRGQATQAAWLDVIAGVRAVFSGQLAINATTYDTGAYSMPLLPFASALDFIGLSFYIPKYTNSPSPGLAELTASWSRNADGIDLVRYVRSVSDAFAKPVAISEVAYRSVVGFNSRPADQLYSAATDYDAQSNLYAAFFEVWNNVTGTWFKGVSFWGWFAEFRPSGATRSEPWYADQGASVQGKPAKSVLTAGFNRLPSDCLFRWAETNYPSLFFPPSTSQDGSGFRYRYYASTRIYLGVSNDDSHVYYLDGGGLHDVGLSLGWYGKSGCN